MAEERLPKEIQIARLRLTKDYPYLATAAWSFIPVNTERVPIMGTDKHWRLYFNPNTIGKLSSEQITGVLYHEILHHLREHMERAEQRNIDHMAWNIAADMEINDDLRAEKVQLPEGCMYPEMFVNRHTGKPNVEGRMAEEYYDGFERQEAPQCSCGSGNQQKNSGTSSSDTSEDGSQDSQNGSESSDSSGAGNSDSNETGNDGQKDGTTPKSHSCGDNSCQDTDSGESQDGTSQPQDGAGSGDQSSGSGGKGTSGGTQGSGQQPDPNCPMHGDNGIPASSSSGTQRASWELGESEARSLSKTEGELVRRKTANEIEKSAKSRGDVPGHLERWAKEKLKPQVPWRQVLRGAVRAAVADKMGAVDYTYQRISRRQSTMPEIVLPALRQPTPKVLIGIDTSGSMSTEELSQGLAEVGGCLKSIGVNELEVFTVDADVQTTQKVRHVGQVKMAGGGGTDMGIAVQYAEQKKPKPDILVIFTDGYTPWPIAPPQGFKVIVVTTGDPGPAWAKTIKVQVKQ